MGVSRIRIVGAGCKPVGATPHRGSNPLALTRAMETDGESVGCNPANAGSIPVIAS